MRIFYEKIVLICNFIADANFGVFAIQCCECRNNGFYTPTEYMKNDFNVSSELS